MYEEADESPDERLKRLLARAEEILPGEPAPEKEDDPRWQAIIAIGDFNATHPEDVWEFVKRWGNHPQEDLRSAVATCLLEHLLEYQFDLLFPCVEAFAQRDPSFADCFSRCAKFGQAVEPENARRFDELLRECRERGDAV